MKIKKVILAISAVAIAMPVKPSTPAIIEIIKNVKTHVNMLSTVPDKYKMKEATNMIKKMIKMTLAISVATTAIPVNPNTAAMMAIKEI